MSAPPFTSWQELRDGHVALLRAQAEPGATPEIARIEAFLARLVETGRSLLLTSDRRLCGAWLDYWEAVLQRNGAAPGPQPRELKEADDRQELALLTKLPEDRCPYPGLRPFTSADRERFFGQESFVQTFLMPIKNNPGEAPFFVLSGPSGSGKSSLLRAGVVADRQDWQIIVPGAEPLERLRLATAAHLGIDQGEELFTHGHDAQTLRRFLAELDARVKAGTQVLMTLRSDYRGRWEELRRELGLLETKVIEMREMGEDGLRDAIMKPAATVGLRLEVGVVERLVTEVRGVPGALPLLQFALRALWAHRRFNLVTWDSYYALGGTVTEALTRCAEEVAEQFSDDKDMLRNLMLQLVRVGEGVGPAARRITRASLERGLTGPVGDLRHRAGDLLDALLGVGLLRESADAGGEIELGHEALLRAWPRLADWIAKHRQALQLRDRTLAAAHQWQAHGRDPGSLWRFRVLEEGKTLDPWLQTEAIREFLDSSQQRQREEEVQADTDRALLTSAREEQGRRIRSWEIVLFAALIFVAATIMAMAIYLKPETRPGNPAAASR